MKHNLYMCEECMHCRDPEIYCKFRTSCPIHFITRRQKNLDDRPKPGKDTLSDKEICKPCTEGM